MLSCTLLMALTMSAGQAEKVTPMPPDLRKQIDDHLIGVWTWEATWGDKTFKGETTTRWTRGKTAVLMQGYSVVDGKRTTDVHLLGWDGVNQALIGRGFTSDGDTGTVRWTEYSKGKWTGQGSGIYMGKPWESQTTLELMKDQTRYQDVTDGKPYVATYTRKVKTKKVTDKK